jgi:hypothetical protein
LTAIVSLLLFAIALIAGMRNEGMYGAGVKYGCYYR